jgi:hypothetical protein
MKPEPLEPRLFALTEQEPVFLFRNRIWTQIYPKKGILRSKLKKERPHLLETILLLT